MNIYTLKDKLIDECGPPYTSKNDQDAIRKACNLMYREKLTLREASQYELWFLTSYESRNGNVVITEDPYRIDWGHDYAMFLDDKYNADIKAGQLTASPEVE